MKERRSLVVLLVLLGPVGIALAQAATAQVSGEVFYQNKQPAVNCTVRIDGKFDYVNGTGEFHIFDVPAGNQTLTVTCRNQLLKQESVIIAPPTVTLPRIVL
jgi:hypothetical protein